MSPEKTPAETREYVVLARWTGTDEADGHWIELGCAHGSTPKQAMATVVAGLPADEQEGTFVAVPVRNWTPLTRRTETVVKASWS